jgi:hypothetical protein
MFPNHDTYDSDRCPVRDELLGEMYRASEHGLLGLVESVSPDPRAMLALFCYRRSHLYSLSLAIAASCSERELVESGGRVGATLHALSREAPPARTPSPATTGSRKPITLSTKPLASFVPIEDELDEDVEAATA